MIGIVIAVIVVLLVLVAIGAYNGLVRQKNKVDNGWAQIDTQLQRRYDLIPNLVETVKAYAAHESETLEKVVRARNQMAKAGSVSEKAQADADLTGTLKTLFAVAESYPDLKANENFRDLQVELTGTENKIAYARQFYNDAVTAFNTATETFPKNIFANLFGFTKRSYYEAENAEARKSVRVDFSK